MLQPRRDQPAFALRFGRSLPYLLLLIAAVFLFLVARRFNFALSVGPGPDLWPKVILGLLMACCLYEIAKNWFFGGLGEVVGTLEVVEDLASGPQRHETEQKHPLLVAGGITLAIAYAFLIDKLGFLLCTFFFLAAFAYIGRYRRHRVILVTSLLGSTVLMLIFMRVVYISLPIGVPPFSSVSIAAMKLMGIN